MQQMNAQKKHLSKEGLIFILILNVYRYTLTVDRTHFDTDNTRDNSIYNQHFPLWLPSNVLISVLVLSLIPQETVVGQELPVFTAAHIKEGLTT